MAIYNGLLRMYIYDKFNTIFHSYGFGYVFLLLLTTPYAAILSAASKQNMTVKAIFSAYNIAL